jgi:alpha-mannosidase
MNKHIHVISHTHWDREWYMSYERHHLKLIRLMDTLLELLEQDPDFKSFHLDGQTIVMEDYLQVRPEKRDKIRRYIQEGRLIQGPWYILQDEFLTSSEANVRNLLIGHRDAATYGPVAKIGYFPDSFGNMGQAPQLMLQAGIDNAVFGRGVKPTGFNNTVGEADYESPYSEMYWESPDGSRVLGILFANWYHNGMEIPAEQEAAREYWDRRIQDVEQYASTSHLLFMNGCDHQPVQTDLSAALRTAGELYPDVTFVHSNFVDYIQAVRDHVPPNLSTVRGELRSQQTDGWGTLVGTASARVYIKQANQHCQALLEKAAEPLAVMAGSAGIRYPHHLLAYNWKTLMQNHPHDSICGCSVDEVHDEMMTRFAKSRHMSEALAEESAAALVGEIDTRVFADYDGAIPFVVFNTSGWKRSGIVSVELEILRAPLYEPSPAEIASRLEAVQLDAGAVIDVGGQPAIAQIEDLGVRFGYELPEDRFRQPYMARCVRITLLAKDVPALGYRAFAWMKGERQTAAAATPSLDAAAAAANLLENEHLAVTIGKDGSFELKDKGTGRVYADLGVYENVGDIGNEYIFKGAAGDAPITTKGLRAEITRLEQSDLRTTYEIVHDWEIPSGADALLQREVETMVPIRERQARRSGDKAPLRITTTLTLERGAKGLSIGVSYNNRAKDHRLRMLFPTDLTADVHHADSIFETAVRDNVPSPVWSNPSNCQHSSAFVAVDESGAGFAVAHKGLNEYEVLRGGRNTIAITLLRSVGELGDWGVFPTPGAQCLGEQSAELLLVPYTGVTRRHEAAIEAAKLHTPWTVRQAAVQSGSLAAERSWLDWSGEALVLTAFKANEDRGDTIVRWYNPTLNPQELFIQSANGEAWYRSSILEEALEELTAKDGIVTVNVKPAEILTLGARHENA